MADVKISALPAASSVAGVDTIPIVQGGVTKKATISQLPTGGGEFLIMSGGINSTVIVDQNGTSITSQ